MSKYVVVGTVTVSCWTEVEAVSEEEALEIAKGRELVPDIEISSSYPVSEFFHMDTDGGPVKLCVIEEL